MRSQKALSRKTMIPTEMAMAVQRETTAAVQRGEGMTTMETEAAPSGAQDEYHATD